MRNKVLKTISVYFDLLFAFLSHVIFNDSIKEIC